MAVVDLATVRRFREVMSGSEKVRQETVAAAERGLSIALATDLTRLNGQQLRTLRDNVFKFRKVLAINSPEYERFIKVALERKHKNSEAVRLTSDELESLLKPFIRPITFAP